MELVYLWVEEYKNIKNQGFNFSPRFVCKFDEDTKELTITENEKYVSIFPENINITAIVGENGSGKSSILEVIKYGGSSNYNFKTKNNLIFPNCFYLLYDENNDKFHLQGAKSNNIIIGKNQIKYTDSYKKIFQNIYYTSSNKVMYYPEISGNYQISEHITNISDAYMYEKFSEEIQKNHNHKLTSYQQLLDYSRDIFIENTTLAFYKNNINLPKKFNKPSHLILSIKYQYIFTSFTEIKLENVLHDKLKRLMNKFERKDRENFEYMIKYIAILSILIQYDRGLKNTLDVKIENILGEIDFNSSNIDTIDKIINKLNKNYTSNMLENRIIEKYFTSIQNIINLLREFGKYYKNEMFSIPYEIEKEKILQLVDLHKNITATISGFLSYSFEPEMSTGYNQFSNFFAKLFYALNYPYNSKPNDKKILLLLDEPDIFLHPDWQKNYLSILIDFLNINYSKFKFHLIITSHSPFILSDLPKENVIFLEEGVEKKLFKENEQTFGANIHTLLSHGFFMSDGIMGEFAKSKINEIKKFYEIVKFLEPKNKKYKRILKILYLFKIKEFEHIQKIIGEPFLQTIIKNYLDDLHLIFSDDKTLINKELTELEKRKEYLESLKNAKNQLF